MKNYSYRLRHRFTGEQVTVDEGKLRNFDVREWELVAPEAPVKTALTVQSFAVHDEEEREYRALFYRTQPDVWLGWGFYIFGAHNFKSEYPERTRLSFPIHCFGKKQDGSFWTVFTIPEDAFESVLVS